MWSQLVIAVSLAWVCVAQLSSAVSDGASLVATSSIASQAARENAASTYVQSNVPTGTPVPGNYTGALRPQIHYSPPQGFMNDPNGLFVDANGTWHLYYQYNPTGVTAGNQHWGHATSPDLYHWTNQQIALFPPTNDTFVFSGCAVIDTNNTSGFFPDQDNGVVAIYTLATYYPDRAGPQQQAIAYSRDGGYTFTPYEGNPVIPSTAQHFRDPKVIWYEDHWVMVVAYAQEFAIGFFTSLNLIDWQATSNFSYWGLLGEQYECPTLVEIPVRGGDDGATKWVLVNSINPGAPLGGSITYYVFGNFNGTHYVAEDQATRLTDFAKDNYASQFFYGTGAPGSDGVSIAWASNWQYTNLVPTAQEGWRSVMSLPRRQYLADVERTGLTLYSEPFSLDPVRGPEIASNSSLGNGTMFANFASVESNSVILQVNVTGINYTTINGAATLNFTFFNLGGESLSGGYYFAGDNPFFLNRGDTNGFDNVFYTDKFSTALPIGQNTEWSMTAVIDRSIFEVFLNSGARAATSVFFPNQPLTQLAVSANNVQEGMDIAVTVYAVESAWAQFENEQGTVEGNVPTTSTSSGGSSKRHMLYEASFFG